MKYFFSLFLSLISSFPFLAECQQSPLTPDEVHCREGTAAIVPARMAVRNCELANCAPGVSSMGDGSDCYYKCAPQVDAFLNVMVTSLEKCGPVPSGICSLIKPMSQMCNSEKLCGRLNDAVKKYCSKE